MKLEDIKPDTSLYPKNSPEWGAARLLVKQAQATGQQCEYRFYRDAAWHDNGGALLRFDYSDEVRVAPPKAPEVIEGYVAVGANGLVARDSGNGYRLFESPASAKSQVARFPRDNPARVFKAVLTEVLP